MSIKSYISSFQNNHVTNNEGYLIITLGEKFLDIPKKYFINDDKTSLTWQESYKYDGFKEKTDILYNSPLDLFDPTLGLFLEFDVVPSGPNNQYKRFVRTRATEGKPLFKKDEYLSLYKGVPTLNEIKNNYSKSLSKILTNFELCES